MGGDEGKTRFAWLVLLFVASIIFLIISPNLIRLLIGWDGLGLVSYCLVIYYQNIRSFNAGIITVLSNRIGDVALLLAIAWMVCWGGWNFLLATELGYCENLTWIVSFCLLAAMTKRAQIPFSAWLPAAIAAPTPVSALVHSSTLVTAGVYLLIRFSPLIESYSVIFSGVLLLISVLTIFMSGLGANFEYDLKKIIALSTLSQLGLIIIILRLGYTKLAFFHLLSHAIFKALLFLCAGAIIHSCSEWQDIRIIGGLVGYMPVIAGCINVANLALCGFPFLAGFYSKDLVIEKMIGGEINMMIIWLALVSVGLTVCYSIRLGYYTMWHGWRLGGVSRLEDGGKFIVPGIMNLTFIAVVVGRRLSWLMFVEPELIILPVGVKLRTIFIVMGGAWLGLVVNWGVNYRGKIEFLGRMWYLPILRSQHLPKGNLILGHYIMKVGDIGWREKIGGQGLYNSILLRGDILQRVQDNSLKIYLFRFLLLVICIIIFIFEIW
jgi:NADH-ubiquinone oxidoreductase chain 5